MQTLIYKDTTELAVLWDDVKQCYCFEDARDEQLLSFTITLQSGDPEKNGYSGPTIEALLAIAQHRIQHYNQGSWKCIENYTAIIHIKSALKSLAHRFQRVTGKQAEEPAE